MRRHALLICFSIAFFVSLLPPSQAAMAEPDGPPVLVIQGMIGHSNCPQGFCIDLAMLKALPQHTIVTAHPWDDGQHAYTGPLLKDVLSLVGASGNQLRLKALDDYSVRFVFDELEAYRPILAWQEDGMPMRIRDRGPLWLMLPLDEHPTLTQMKYLSTMIWQLAMIDVGL